MSQLTIDNGQLKNKKKVPELRFPEFSGEWEEKKLGKVVEISKSKYNPAKSSHSYKCIELENLSQETGMLLGYHNSKEQQSIKNKFKKGEVLFGKLRPYLKKYWKAQFDGVCSSEIWVLKGKKGLSNNYLYQLIQSDKFNYIANISSGSKMPRADWSYMSGILFDIPCTSEQQKIANFFSLIDKKIEKQEEKISDLEEYKRGMMQKIFSQEIRFKDDNGEDYPEWTEKKLGEIGSFKTSSVNKVIYPDEKVVKLINYMDVYNHKNINNDNLNELSDTSAKYSQIEGNNLLKGDILFTPSSETPEDIGHSIVVFEDLIDTVYSYHVLRFRPTIDLNILYSHYFCNIESVRSQLVKFATGSTRFTISIKDFSEVIVPIPSLLEQQRIANLLALMDSKIEKEKDKLGVIKELKKGFMQKMFV